MPNRDTRPPTDANARVEAALDARVLAALAAAWNMAKERRLISGSYYDREDVVSMAKDSFDLTITDALAADILQGLEDAEEPKDHGEAVWSHVWNTLKDYQ